MSLPRYSALLFALLAPLLMSSCSLLGLGGEEEPPATAEEGMKSYDDYLASAAANADGMNYNVASSEDLERIDNGVEGEVFFTNPDDPDEEIAGITEAFEDKRTGQRWLSSYLQAMRFSRLKGLPVIIWFHDSAISPKSKELGRELLQTPEFMDWCTNRVICACLDSGLGMDETKAVSGSSDQYRNVTHLQRRYQLKKKPSFVVISPNGKVVLSIDGFDGFTGGLEGDLKRGVAEAEAAYADYKKGLLAKGFRLWRSADGQKTMLAKLTRFDEKTDMLYLKTDSGRQTKIHESQFDNADVDYIENNIRKGGPKY